MITFQTAAPQFYFQTQSTNHCIAGIGGRNQNQLNESQLIIFAEQTCGNLRSPINALITKQSGRPSWNLMTSSFSRFIPTIESPLSTPTNLQSWNTAHKTKRFVANTSNRYRCWFSRIASITKLNTKRKLASHFHNLFTKLRTPKYFKKYALLIPTSLEGHLAWDIIHVKTRRLHTQL